MRDNYGAGVNVILYIAWGLSFLWIEVADKGDYLLVTTGPCRWLMCGWGKEKVKYSDVRDFQIVKSCWFMTPGVCCTGVRIPFYCTSTSPRTADHILNESACTVNMHCLDHLIRSE